MTRQKNRRAERAVKGRVGRINYRAKVRKSPKNPNLLKKVNPQKKANPRKIVILRKKVKPRKKVNLPKKANLQRKVKSPKSRALKSLQNQANQKKEKKVRPQYQATIISIKIPGKLTHEQKIIKEYLDTYDNTLLEILHNLEFWDKKNCSLTSPFSAVVKKHDKKQHKTKKKSKSTKGSPKSLQTTTETTINDTARTSSPDIGVPCWLLNRALHTNFENFIPSMMEETVVSEISHEKQVKYEFIEPPKLQSVFPKPKHRSLRKTEVFHIVDYVEEKDLLV